MAFAAFERWLRGINGVLGMAMHLSGSAQSSASLCLLEASASSA